MKGMMFLMPSGSPLVQEEIIGAQAYTFGGTKCLGKNFLLSGGGKKNPKSQAIFLPPFLSFLLIFPLEKNDTQLFRIKEEQHCEEKIRAKQHGARSSRNL